MAKQFFMIEKKKLLRLDYSVKTISEKTILLHTWENKSHFLCQRKMENNQHVTGLLLIHQPSRQSQHQRCRWVMLLSLIYLGETDQVLRDPVVINKYMHKNVLLKKQNLSDNVTWHRTWSQRIWHIFENSIAPHAGTCVDLHTSK